MRVDLLRDIAASLLCYSGAMRYRYHERAPVPELRALVDRLWTLEPLEPADGPTRLRLLPDGGTDLVVTLWRNGGVPRVEVAGVYSAHRLVPLDGVRAYVGVRLHPAAAGAVLGCPATEVTDAHVPLADVWEASIPVLETPRTPGEARGALERMLAARLARRRPGLDAAAQAVAVRIERRRHVSVRNLAREIGLGERQLRRRFAAAVGLAPSVYAAVARPARVIQVARGGRVLSSAPRGGSGSWSSAALDAGYYDQSHMIHDFRAIVGRTPSAWRREVTDPAATPRCLTGTARG